MARRRLRVPASRRHNSPVSRALERLPEATQRRARRRTLLSERTVATSKTSIAVPVVFHSSRP